MRLSGLGYIRWYKQREGYATLKGPIMIYWILALMTLIGGIAGLLFLRDRISGRTTPKPASEPEIKWVDLNYPSDIGLQQQLESEGYRVRWCTDDNLARRLDIEGWELVLQELEDGRKVMLKIKDRVRDQTLIKKRG